MNIVLGKTPNLAINLDNLQLAYSHCWVCFSFICSFYFWIHVPVANIYSRYSLLFWQRWLPLLCVFSVCLSLLGPAPPQTQLDNLLTLSVLPQLWPSRSKRCFSFKRHFSRQSFCHSLGQDQYEFLLMLAHHLGVLIFYGCLG